MVHYLRPNFKSGSKSQCSLALKVVPIAEKYGMEELKGICADFLKQRVMTQNVVSVFMVADRNRWVERLHEIDARRVLETICSSARSLRTAHSFATLRTARFGLARSAALFRSLARSLTHSRAHGKEFYMFMN